MTRLRIRPAHGPHRLATMYATPHDHRQWPDHLLRVDMTIQMVRWMASGHGGGLPAGAVAGSAADLSCGNGEILRSVGGAGVHYLGDLAPGYQYAGPIEDTLQQIPDVDLFVCAETLEHLDDPDAVLAGIRQRARVLVLSTPVEAWGDSNPEHYWAWSREDVEDMLKAAGWTPGPFTALDFRPVGLPYCFGIWGAT